MTPTASPSNDKPSAPPATKAKPPTEPKDTFHEIVETVVFVVVLVLLLKTFVAEAFVIPTGSMAETLYGYQKLVTCPQCGYQFPVNCSQEIDPQIDQAFTPILGCTCPNCQNQIDWRLRNDHNIVAYDRDGRFTYTGPDWHTGDRVLVAKYLYDAEASRYPGRHDVVVFKFPESPHKNQVPMNYIKRLEGLPGETVAIFNGDLYVTRSLTYDERDEEGQPKYPRSHRPEDRWKSENLYVNAAEAVELMQKSLRRSASRTRLPDDFQIVRKPPSKMLALRRIVYDNNFQPKDLADQPPRWHSPDQSWGVLHEGRAFEIKSGEGESWLRYRHLTRLRPVLDRHLAVVQASDTQPQAITNQLGYNSGKTQDRDGDLTRVDGGSDGEWVGDLMLEATVEVLVAQGEFVMELSRQADRFQARFDLATGQCRLMRVGRDDPLAVQNTKMNRAGVYRLRFANFDERLTVWVDRTLPFGDGIDYTPTNDAIGTWDDEELFTKLSQPNPDNDIERPASLLATGGAALRVSDLRLWRDTYYTTKDSGSSFMALTNSGKPIRTYYVQPGHFLCLGDNSAQSADSRFWGLVPERLMLGRAMMVYWPWWRIGGIR